MESKKPAPQNADFSFGLQELRATRRAREKPPVGGAEPQSRVTDRGFDPYNTSGSFDRKTHWTRVGRR